MAIPPHIAGGVNAIDVVEHYRFPAGFDGTGQRIALVEIEGSYVPDELEIYCTLAGLPMPNVIDVPVGPAPEYQVPETVIGIGE